MNRYRSWVKRAIVLSSCGALAALTGCSGARSVAPDAASSVLSSGPPSSPTQVAATAGAAGPVAPLTGLAGPAAVTQRPAVAVAVASTAPAGLSAADLVYEQMTSPTRYLAVYQSTEAAGVGPVTSTRPADGAVLSVLHPLTGYDGGTSAFISVLDATKIIDDGYARHPSFYSAEPGGLAISTAPVAASGQSDGPPPPMFSYRRPGNPLASARETHPASIQIAAPGQLAEQWTFNAAADRWVETAGGPRVSVANLIVQIVPFKAVYLSKRYGLTTQSARVTGSGPVTVFSGTAPGGTGGTAAGGTWSKPGIAAQTNFFDTASQPMEFEPGPTWVLLAPAGTRTSQAAG